jgi:hypothetical protein
VTNLGRPAPFEWAVAERPLAGETVSGDLAVVVANQDEYLLAGIDGLGHGQGAATAAAAAADTIRANPGEPLDNLLVLCHQAMQATRGAAITVARVHTGLSSLSWVGVGNVDAYLIRRTPTGTAPINSPILSGGIVGFDLPRVSVLAVDLRRGDIVVLATDGIGPAFTENLNLGVDVQGNADRIMNTCAKGTDDALVVVSRFWGHG